MELCHLQRLGLVTLLVIGAVISRPTPGTAQDDRSIFSVLDTQGRTVMPATSTDGMLGPDDVISAGGRRVQVWSLSAQPGEGVQVDLRSADFDAFLYVVGPGLGEGLRDDDGGDGLNSRLCVSLDQAGEYRIVASSLGGGTGSFTLDVTEVSGGVNGECPEAPAAQEISNLADLATEGRRLRVGDDAQGRLGNNDARVFGAPAQAWAVDGVGGASFSVDMVSDEFDAYLMVEGPGFDEWLQDDDGAGRCNSRLSFTFPQTGTYRVVASSLGASTGAFRLIAAEAPGAVDPEGCAPGTPDDGSYTVEEAASLSEISDVGVLSSGRSMQGAMNGDEAQYEGRSLQGWSLEGQAGDRVAIELRSADFDSYLYFSGPGFSEPLRNDDGAEGLNSLICVELPESGFYRVLAGPLSGNGAGDRYTLTATWADGGETMCESFEQSPALQAAQLAALPTNGRRIAAGEEQEGELSTSEERHPESGRPIQAWSFDAPGERVFIDLVSDDFDAYIYAVGGAIPGELYNDDFGGAAGCHSRLEIGPDVSGEITLLLGSYYESASGRFRVRASRDPGPMEEGGCDDSGPDYSGGVEVSAGVTASLTSGEERAIQLGTEVLGRLGTDGETLPDGQPAQTWSVELTAGDAVVVEVLSDDFDTVLYLDGPGLYAPLTDDDGMGMGTNSRIEYTAVESGRFRIVVSAFSSDVGTFRLRVIRTAG